MSSPHEPYGYPAAPRPSAGPGDGWQPYGGLPASGHDGARRDVPLDAAGVAPEDPYQAAPAPPDADGQAPYGVAASPLPPALYVPVPSQSGMAVAGLVLGIVSFWMCGVTAVPGLVLSILGIRETAGGAKVGRGLAVAGLVLSILGCLGLLMTIGYFLYVSMSAWGIVHGS